jgi:two-component system chemotaxis sensor kinase CheA
VAKKRSTRRRRNIKADQEFVSEAEEIIEHMRDDLADLEDQRSSSDEVDPDLVNRIFRSAHSLKALAGMFGFDPIQELAHRLEDILDDLRLGRVSIRSSAVPLIDEAVDIFGTMLQRIGDADAFAAAGGEIQDLTARIEAARSEVPAGAGGFEGLDLAPSLLRALTEYEEHRLRENIERGRHIILAESTFEIISFEEGLSELSAAIREIGEVLSTLPAPGETPESEIRFSLLSATDLTLAELSSRLAFPNARVRTVLCGRDAASGQPPAPGPVQKPVPEPSSPSSEPPQEPVARKLVSESEGMNSLKSISDTVRVDIRKLDELMNLVGELVIQRGAIGEIVQRLLAASETARIGNDLSKVYKNLDRKLKGLQASVLDVRMVPLRQVFDKVSRVIRGLRRELDKDVRLEIRGADTELDKLIVEQLVDPLMHIVRNSLDHAIEKPDERIAAGKDPEGCIKVDAFQRGNHVVIAVSDDGLGIDIGKLRAIAERRGIVAPDEVLSEQEALDLVFAPGISTREEVTETSGRGVGMDIVRSNVTSLGGVVDISSIPGRGTTISMTLPITLAIVQSLIVKVADQRFAIPLNSVLETLLVGPDDIQRSEGREMLNLRGDALQLRRLAVEFQLDRPARDAKQFVVVLGMGDLRIGLLVDGLEGQQDTVIKPIQGPIQNVRGVAGATELGDQDPVLVLDTASFMDDSVRRREAA